MKAHNGGAISALCTYIFNQNHDDYYSTSSINSVFALIDTFSDLVEPVSSVLDGFEVLNVYTFKFNIDSTQFIENYSGLKGTAAYFKQMSKVRITNSLIQNNGPVFSSQEYSYSPHTTYLTNNAISFYDP